MTSGAQAVVGIEKVGVYPCALALDIRTLCEARGLDATNFCDRLYCDERSLMGPFEDVVTLAVNAAKDLLTDADREHVRFLLVATESAVDQEKPLSSWVHHFLGLRSDCRNLEVKHACYGATGAARLAASFLVTDPDPEARALVINADHALIGIEGVQEPVLGAGAAAVLLSKRPRLVRYELGRSGVFAHEVADIFRPAPGVETGDADESLMSYLDGVEECWDAYVRAAGEPVDFDRDFAANVYHVPFGGLAERAHLRLCRHVLGLSKRDALAHYERKSKPSLRFNRRMGGVYGAATYVALLSLLEAMDLAAGSRVGIYAYGSGSCAELYSVLVEEGAREVAAAARVAERLAERLHVDVPTYERCERETHAALAARDHAPDASIVPGLWERWYAGKGRLVLRGIEDYRRRYEWS